MKKQDAYSKVQSRNASVEKGSVGAEDDRSDLSLSRSQSPVADKSRAPARKANHPKALDRLDTSCDRLTPSQTNFDVRKIFGEVEIQKQKKNGPLEYKSNNSEDYEFDSNSTMRHKRNSAASNGLKTQTQGRQIEKENLRAVENASQKVFNSRSISKDQKAKQANTFDLELESSPEKSGLRPSQSRAKLRELAL